MFTIFNCFIAPPSYDGADRQFIKIFLETCDDCIRRVLRVGNGVPIHFLIQIFEAQFGEKVPKDRYDISQMAILFGEKLVKEL